MPHSYERSENVAFCIRIDGVVRPMPTKEVKRCNPIGCKRGLHLSYNALDTCLLELVPKQSLKLKLSERIACIIS